MSNSSLICYTKISPNKNSPRNHVIDTITIHCMAGKLSHITCGQLFADPKRQASSNYGIGPDGKIALYVDEGDRSWASNSSSNDNRAVTIEVASEAVPPYAVTDAAYESLIKLCADICKRNNIKELKWKGDKSLIGQVDKQNMTAHRWFKNKACPGDYLYNRFGDIANRVNSMIAPAVVQPTPAPTPAVETPSTNTTTVVPGGQLVKIISSDGMNIRKGPGTNYAIVGTVPKNGVYTITSYSGEWGKLKSGAGWINCNAKYVQKISSTPTPAAPSTSTQTTTVTPAAPQVSSNGKPIYKVGSNYVLQEELKVRKGPGTNYAAKKYNELTSCAKKFDKDRDGALDKGTTVTCQQVINQGNNIWMRIPSGYIAAYFNGNTYVK